MNRPVHSKLLTIIEQKQKEIARLRSHVAEDPKSQLAKVFTGEIRKQPAHFKQILAQPGLRVIAEIKRRSPSKGDLAEIRDPKALAQRYIQGGATALSVLTDRAFSGSLRDLEQVRKAIPRETCPILQKDFMLDPLQLAQAVISGADCILLIVAVLQDKTKALLELARDLQLDALVEVHTQAELQYALDIGADMIGINNRDLHTFEVDTQTALKLSQFIPEGIIKIAESGIDTPALARAYAAAGFNAVLVGEALVKAEDPGALIQAFQQNSVYHSDFN